VIESSEALQSSDACEATDIDQTAVVRFDIFQSPFCIL